jgi:hypothetical protein
VQEILARLSHHTINSPIAQINVTLDNNTNTFPLDQQLNFDFSHDTNIMSVLTAFGFRQFAKVLPADRMVERELVVSHLVCCLDKEILVCCKGLTRLGTFCCPSGYGNHQRSFSSQDLS